MMMWTKSDYQKKTLLRSGLCNVFDLGGYRLSESSRNMCVVFNKMLTVVLCVVFDFFFGGVLSLKKKLVLSRGCLAM